MLLVSRSDCAQKYCIAYEIRKRTTVPTPGLIQSNFRNLRGLLQKRGCPLGLPVIRTLIWITVKYRKYITSSFLRVKRSNAYTQHRNTINFNEFTYLLACLRTPANRRLLHTSGTHCPLTSVCANLSQLLSFT